MSVRTLATLNNQFRKNWSVPGGEHVCFAGGWQIPLQCRIQAKIVCLRQRCAHIKLHTSPATTIIASCSDANIFTSRVHRRHVRNVVSLPKGLIYLCPPSVLNPTAVSPPKYAAGLTTLQRRPSQRHRLAAQSFETSPPACLTRLRHLASASGRLG